MQNIHHATYTEKFVYMFLSKHILGVHAAVFMCKLQLNAVAEKSDLNIFNYS